MRNIAIIALLLACVSVAGNAGNRKKFDLMKQENMKMKDKAEIYLAGGCFWGTEHFLKQIRGVGTNGSRLCQQPSSQSNL